MTIIASKPDPRAARQARQRLVALGIDRGIVAATPDIDLPRLARRTMTQLTLVPDVDTDAASAAQERAERIQRMYDDCAPDEVASILTFARGELVEAQDVTGFVPWGGGAA